MHVRQPFFWKDYNFVNVFTFLFHMKAAHTVLYMKKHTQTYASYPAMDISCMSVV